MSILHATVHAKLLIVWAKRFFFSPTDCGANGIKQVAISQIRFFLHGSDETESQSTSTFLTAKGLKRQTQTMFYKQFYSNLHTNHWKGKKDA